MRVIVASDLTLIGTSLIALLQSLPWGEPVETQLCHTSRIGEVVCEWRPDVVLIEASVDFAAAISTVQALADKNTSAHIVLLGKEADEATVYEAVLEGADGYLTGEVSPDVLARTLRGVARGELGLPRRVAKQVVHQLRRAARARPQSLHRNFEDRLTPREQEVFALVRRGMRSREIAQQLTIADATVYKHIQKILDKLQVHSRTQAIVMSGPPGGGPEAPDS